MVSKNKRNWFFFISLQIFFIYINRHLERARIVFAIENEMSTKERNLPTNKYWTNIDGERYLQVEEVDDKGFVGEEDDDQNGGDNKKDNDIREDEI